MEGVTEQPQEEDQPEAPVQKSTQVWYEENKERLDNIELDIPEVPEGATEEDVAKLNKQVQQQWQEKAAALYKQEVEDPHLAKIKVGGVKRELLLGFVGCCLIVLL